MKRPILIHGAIIFKVSEYNSILRMYYTHCNRALVCFENIRKLWYVRAFPPVKLICRAANGLGAF